MKRWIFFVFVLGVPTMAAAQGAPLAFGTLGAASETVCTGTAGNQPLGTSAAVNFQITGTFTGTVTFQGTSNNSLTLTSIETANLANGTTAATTTTTGTYAVTNTGFLRVCATMTSYTSGTATVNITRGYGSGGAGGGGGASGDVNLTEIGGGAVTTTVPGALDVNIVGGSSSGVQYTQDAALTVATSVGTMAMGRASAAVPTDVSADNDAVMPWYLRSGAGVTQPTFGGVLAVAGNGAPGTGVQRVTIANDSTGVLATLTTLTGGGIAAGAADSGNPLKVGGVYNSTLPTLDNGDRGNLQLAVDGSLIVKPSLTGAFATDTTQDAAAGTTGPQIMGLGKNTTLPTAVTDGDAVRLLTDLAGRLRPKNVCADPELVSSVVISTATSGNVELVAISGTTVPVVCGFNVVGGGTVGVQFIVGTGTACATNELNKTGVYPLVVNSGINSGFGAPIFKGAAGDAVCVELSAAVQIDGILTYASVSVP